MNHLQMLQDDQKALERQMSLSTDPMRMLNIRASLEDNKDQQKLVKQELDMIKFCDKYSKENGKDLDYAQKYLNAKRESYR